MATKLWRIFFVWLFILTLAVPATASEYLVNKNGNQENPVAAGDIVVWEDDSMDISSIYLHNFSTGETKRISEQGSRQYSPHTDGQYVVWIDNKSGEQHISLYNISTGKTKKITTISSEKRSPKVEYPYVVWSDYKNKTWEIMAYNISTGETKTIAKHNYGFLRGEFNSDGSRRAHYDAQLSIAISGDKIVWTDFRNQNWDLYGANLKSGEQFPVVVAQRDQLSPDLDGNLLVYQDYSDYNWDIYLYDFDSDSTKVICNAGRDQENPSISDGFVAWQDFRNQRWDIYGYDLNANREIPLVSKARHQTHPTVSNGRVIFMDNTNQREDIAYVLVPGGIASGDLSDIPGLKIVVNGKLLEKAQPINEAGRVLVPVRAVSEALGVGVNWDGSLQEITLKGHGKEIILYVDSDEALINNIVYPLDVPAQIVDGSTYVPLRFVAQAFDAKVNWDGSKQLVEISW